MSAVRRSASARFSEREAVRLFASAFAPGSKAGVRLGIGDDAAVIDVKRGPLVLTVDAAVEGTHFEHALIGPRDLGWKSFHAAASDLAAMGARPLAALSALELPRGFEKRELARLCRGQAEAARAVGCALVGGNVARAERLAITTTLVGTAAEPLTRSGARPGDELWLVGEVGLAGLGFRLLRARFRARPTQRSAYRRAVSAWQRPQAQIERGLGLVGRARAVIDVSDGLGGDVDQLARASGVRAVLEAPALLAVLSPALQALAPLVGTTALELALAGGEDYALVAAGPKARRPRWAKPIGRIERGRGTFLEMPGTRLRALGPGFDHFTH